MVNMQNLKAIAKKVIPLPIHKRLGALLKGDRYRLPVGSVNLGDVRRLTPVSECWGFDRGLPIDRYYIENFLLLQSGDIQGRVLEIGDASYTLRFGGDRVTKSDVFHVVAGNPEATITGDFANADHIPSNTFDCLILTETLQFVYDVRSAIETIHRILKPGGVVLVTVPGITQLYDPQWRDGWYWNYTIYSMQRLFEEAFPSTHIQVKTHGNVLVATAFLQGLAAEEMSKEELDYQDIDYEVAITVRAIKPEVSR
jgi:SAM-dependent methyltransferase